jgi:hypothetical protein
VHPMVEAPGGGKSFEDWIDSLTDPGKEMLDRALAEEASNSMAEHPCRTF